MTANWNKQLKKNVEEQEKAESV